MDDTTHDINLSVIAELIEELEQDLLTLEEMLDTPKDLTEFVHHAFRTAHNLKSSFGMIRREASSALVHTIESNFDLIRNGFAKPTSMLLHQSLLAVDAMRFNIFLPEERTDELERLQKELELLYADAAKGGRKEAVEEHIPLSDRQKKLFRSMVAENFTIFQVEKVISPQTMSRQVFDNLPIYDDIREVGIHIATIPEFEALPKNSSETVVKILLATTFTAEELEMHIFDPVRPVDPRAVADSPSLQTSSSGTQNTAPAILSEQGHKGLDTEHIRPKKRMNILVAEDDFVSRTVIHEILLPFGTVDLAADGREAVMAFEQTMADGGFYDLICLDIMMPILDGTIALERMREYEVKKGIIGNTRAKIVMTTALDSMDQVFKAFRLQCDAYLVKPITKAKVLNQLRKLHLIEY